MLVWAHITKGHNYKKKTKTWRIRYKRSKCVWNLSMVRLIGLIGQVSTKATQLISATIGEAKNHRLALKTAQNFPPIRKTLNKILTQGPWAKNLWVIVSTMTWLFSAKVLRNLRRFWLKKPVNWHNLISK